LIRAGAAGINFLEVAGEVELNGKRFCGVASGRAILTADNGSDLARTGRIRLMATRPGRIEFARPIRAIRVLSPGSEPPLGDATAAAAC